MPAIHVSARSLPERIVYGVLLLAVLVLGFFFLVAALIAGAILAGIVLLRFWWLKRRLRKAADEEFITADYTVVERERPAAPRLPPQ
ncbi:MAG TPA: hypothetical protein VFO57_06115 [Burkholderiales bacterium]|nr:hypothetical protein [Burkholderiales bacterium]